MKTYNTSSLGLPNGWIWATLEDCVDILDGQRVPINAKEREQRKAGKSQSELFPYYGATGQVDWIDGFLFNEELVLLGEDGAPFLEPLKAKAYVIKGKSWVNNHAHVLRAISGLLSSLYLCNYLNIFDYQNYVTGTTRLKLNQAPMRKIPIPLAPFNEQVRIVARLEELFARLDAGVEGLRKVKAQLKRYRQAVLKYAFEGKLTEKWRKTHKDQIEPATKLLERIKQERREKLGTKYKEPPPIDVSRLPELPESWMWIRLGEISKRMQYGTSEKASTEPSGIPVLRMGNIQEGKIVFDELKYFHEDWSQLNEFLLNDGDVLFNRTNSAELVGKTAVYREHHPKAVFASYLIRVQVDKTVYIPGILSFFINSFYGRKYISSVVSQQVGQANVNGTKLSLMPIPLIPYQEQIVIQQEIERCFSITDEMEEATEQSLKQADLLRQSILKMAFEGKLAPQDPSDEPAEKLLERIKAERAKSKGEKVINKKKNKPKQLELSAYVE